MAKVKYGEMISDMRGKINGTVHSKNRYGSYMKKKQGANASNTTSQSAVRNLFSYLTKNWKALTASQRNSWLQGVASFKRLNSLADSITLTGSNLYIALNRNLQAISASLITSCPNPTTTTDLTSASVTGDVSDAKIELTFAPTVPAGTAMLIKASAPQSAGVSNAKTAMRIIGTKAAAQTSPQDITALYEAVFGTGWKVAGVKLFVDVQTISTTTGIPATKFRTNAIVTA